MSRRLGVLNKSVHMPATRGAHTHTLTHTRTHTYTHTPATRCIHTNADWLPHHTRMPATRCTHTHIHTHTRTGSLITHTCQLHVVHKQTRTGTLITHRHPHTEAHPHTFTPTLPSTHLHYIYTHTCTLPHTQLHFHTHNSTIQTHLVRTNCPFRSSRRLRPLRIKHRFSHFAISSNDHSLLEQM